ncbi:unnamed protein product [Gordionus sp. m RMFG-2023]
MNLKFINILPIIFLTAWNVGLGELCLPQFSENKIFRIIWNSPTQICKDTFDISLNLHKYGIEANPEDRWFGSLINIFYDTKFGEWPMILPVGGHSEKMINGGIPQRANLSVHLERVRKSVEEIIPDVNFKGFGVLDIQRYRTRWEDIQWHPYNIYREEILKYHNEKGKDKNVSIGINKNLVKEEYNSATRQFFERTLELLTQLRPKAKWGFYSYPRGSRKWNSPNEDKIITNQTRELSWLYEASSALYPSVYPNRLSLPDMTERLLYNLKAMHEALKVSNNRQKGEIPVFPYSRYHYTHEKFPSFVSPNEYGILMRMAFDMGTDGMIIWDSSDNIGNCSLVNKYVKSVIGPTAMNIIKYAKSCSDINCNGNGKCILDHFYDNRHLTEEQLRQYITSLNDKNYWQIRIYSSRYKCRCKTAWRGKNCDENN